MSTDLPRDWRGTEITAGALVIYGAPVSRSIAMVEATVAPEPFITPAGKIRLDVVRRAFGYASADRVSVGADRLTVVSALPASGEQTEAEKRAEMMARLEESNRIRNTHMTVRGTYRHPAGYSYEADVCAQCGTNRPWDSVCAGGVR